jgi:hypothetical protein
VPVIATEPAVGATPATTLVGGEVTGSEPQPDEQLLLAVITTSR